jgi:putative ABC transport system ATP-binding protein
MSSGWSSALVAVAFVDGASWPHRPDVRAGLPQRFPRSRSEVRAREDASPTLLVMTAPPSVLLAPPAPLVSTAARPSVLVVERLTKRYGRGAGTVHALRDVSVAFPAGSFTAIMGPSGSGKSTFLHAAAGLEAPTSGSVRLDGVELVGMGETALTKLRRQRIGFVFQAFNLLPALDVRQNILLPARLGGRRADKRWVAEVIERVGLSARVHHRPSQLSGGQQQRVAIARSLVMNPAVLFADEPTGALDTRTSRDILHLLRECVDRDGLTIVMVTHDPVAAAHADAVVLLADGQIVDRVVAPTAEHIADRLVHLGD